MSWKVIAGTVILTLGTLAGTAFLVQHFAFAAGAASIVADCTTKMGKQTTAYERAQTEAVTKAAKAQAAADAQQIADLKVQLTEAQNQTSIAQSKAAQAKATADVLTANLARLQNESKDVDAWSAACLPGELLRSLHPETGGKAPAGSCR